MRFVEFESSNKGFLVNPDAVAYLSRYSDTHTGIHFADGEFPALVVALPMGDVARRLIGTWEGC